MKVFRSDNTHTQVSALMAFFFEAACVIRSLLSSHGKSGCLAWLCNFCVGVSVCGSVSTCSLHYSDVPCGNCIDFSIGSSSFGGHPFTWRYLLFNCMSCWVCPCFNLVKCVCVCVCVCVRGLLHWTFNNRLGLMNPLHRTTPAIQRLTVHHWFFCLSHTGIVRVH